MRLLDTTTLELVEYALPPPYAILSHCWGADEVNHKDYACVRKDLQYDDAQRAARPWLEERVARSRGIQARSGYAKILRFCGIAKRDGHAYAWIDTCYKRSSAELSESINAMWVWYEKAAICYVLLSDVPLSRSDDREWWSVFSDSRWFTRGWTLGELLAPKRLSFLAQDWSSIGECNKGRRPVWMVLNPEDGVLDLTRHLSQITGISQTDLCSFRRSQSHRYSIAARMSWAAGRQTTKPEDAAYSLLGLFNVNMPLLYGEGKSAFIRLQREILQHSDDQSILAWKTPCTAPSKRDPGQLGRRCDSTGALAVDPSFFRDCGNITALPAMSRRVQAQVGTESLALTNRGLELTVAAAPYLADARKTCYFLRFNCRQRFIAHDSSAIASRSFYRPSTMLVECLPADGSYTGPMLVYRRLLSCATGGELDDYPKRVDRLTNHGLVGYGLPMPLVWEVRSFIIPMRVSDHALAPLPAPQ
ncbi:hypothetical protein LTR53_010487 [Teratosphaeriaceae sp. CCFEE 6253]|nr:hypothetical protein LTR53_010487 [Teratosphaeriaceae sp. CCFEE 6253]